MKKIVVLFLVMFFIPASYVNAQEELLLLQRFEGHDSFVTSVDFSPDGKYIASGSFDKTIKLWAVETAWIDQEEWGMKRSGFALARGTCIKTLKGHTGSVDSVSFSPDGKYVVSRSGKTIKLWRVPPGECVKTLEEHDRYLYLCSVSFSPDGKYIASGWASGRDGTKTIKLWSVKTGKCKKILKGHAGSKESVSFSPDGKYIASGGFGTIGLWSVKTGKCIKTLKGHTGDVNSVSFSPDGKYIASGSYDKTVKLWSVETGECIKTLKGHTGSVESVSFSPGGKYIISATDYTIKLWLLERDECMTIRGYSCVNGTALALSPNGKYIVLGNVGGTVDLLRNVALCRFAYISSADTELKSVTGKVLTKLPMGTKVGMETIEKECLYVKVSETLKGWVKEDDVSFEKPDMMKPVVRIVEKSFKEPNLYLRGVVYDDTRIVEVKFGDLYLPRASFEVEKGNYQDVYPFEAKITLTPGMKLTLEAQDKSRKITKVPINIEEPIIDYTPKYVQLEVKKKAPVRKEPSIKSDVLTEVSEKTVLMAIGEKDKWYYLEGGGWIYGDVVKEKEIGIREMVSKPVEVIPAGGKKGPRIVEKPVDVDVNIPEGGTELKDGLCVIFGIEEYRYAPEATFANRDAEIFCEYAKSVFGLPEKNIYIRTNKGATKGEFDKVFGENGWIEKRIVKGESDVIIYFSGHGAPDIKTKKAYLIPHDIDPNYASSAYLLEDVYRNLSKLGAKSVTIFLDACFSGVSREKEALLADARPLRVRPGSPETYENITVFTASTGEEISSSCREKKHGLFTYYLLKGLQGHADQNKDKKVSVGELFDYLKENVSKEAGFMDREQSPQLLGGKKERLIIRLK